MSSSILSSSIPQINQSQPETLSKDQKKLVDRGHDLAKLWLGIDIDMPQEILDHSVFENNQLLAEIPKKFNAMIENNKDKIEEISVLFLFEMYKLPRELSKFPSVEMIGIKSFKSEYGSLPIMSKLKTLVLGDDTFKLKSRSVKKLKSVEEVVLETVRLADFIMDLPKLNFVVYPGDFESILSRHAKETSEQRRIDFYDSQKKAFHKANGSLIN